MSTFDKPTLSVSFYDPEAEIVPEPEPEPTPKRRGRPPGTKNKKVKPKINWFVAWRAFFWAAVALVSVASLYRGVQGWLGQSAAYLALAVSVLVAAFLLDRDWKKMRAK